MKSVEEYQKEGENVLVRVDYNVDVNALAKKGEHFKLSASSATLEHLFRRQAKVALLTHLGSPRGPDPAFSIRHLVPTLTTLLGRTVRHVADCVAADVPDLLARLGENEVILLENVRYHAEEKNNDSEFARRLAAPFDAYVNEAFGVCHRAHASVRAITRFLPSYAGLHLLEEIKQLEQVRLAPEHPAVAIIGGAKIETKLPLIQALELNYDAILVGGKIANEALDRGEVFSDKVHLPLDFDSPERLDIGPKTIETYRRVIETARTIVWNGPLGKFEDAAHARGTLAIFEAVSSGHAFTVMGGGESLDIVARGGSYDKVNFVSTGGGAMLEFLSGRPLPGLQALEHSTEA